MTMGKHLIIGASGQLGVELMLGLQERHGHANVILSDLHSSPHPDAARSSFVALDATDKEAQRTLFEAEDIEVVYNLVAMLSAKGEQDPMAAWKLNMEPLLHTLEMAREGLVERVFWPSSMAVFGADAPKNATPQESALNPTTVYGVSKTAGELWCNYYHETFGVDVRSIRYPGLIGFRSMPGGGTTDYAVDAFHCAIDGRPLCCYLDPDERLPMMSMSDAVRGTLQLMEAPRESISVRTSYNLHGCDFTPAELTAAIALHLPGFETTYQPDHRQAIAASWPDTLDDSVATRDWDWKSTHNVNELVTHMLEGLAQPTHR
ncbi:MAG: NAD-dependent epimerase/dehydratase family protein [Bacteroidota bacterium]|nr:NAD-dependent epimerase/dehydratase family protein [Bacteroidota bacterium]